MKNKEQQVNISIIETINAISEAIIENNKVLIDQILESLNPAETADIMDALPTEVRRQLLTHIPEGQDGEVLLHMTEGAAIELVEDMDSSALLSATESMVVQILHQERVVQVHHHRLVV